MKEALFNSIYDSLFDHYFECKKNLSHISTKEDFENMSLSQIKNLREWSCTALSDMTTIVMVDFYHVIGMGNLTAVQSSRLNSLLHKYLSYRPLLKAIIGHFNSLEDVPDVPKGCKYVLQKLAKGMVLKNGEGEGFEEVAYLGELAKKREMPTECNFKLEGMTIYLREDQVRNFFDNFNKLGCGTSGEFKNFERKLTNHGNYLGIKWEALVDGNWIGKVTVLKIYERLKAWYENSKKQEVE